MPILRILLFFLVGLFIAAVLIVLVEPATIPDFHTALYFSMVTIATVGYGDLSLKTLGGRFLMTLIIIVAFIGVPVMAIEISKVIKAQPKSMDRKYKVPLPPLSPSSFFLFSPSLPPSFSPLFFLPFMYIEKERVFPRGSHWRTEDGRS